MNGAQHDGLHRSPYNTRLNARVASPAPSSLSTASSAAAPKGTPFTLHHNLTIKDEVYDVTLIITADSLTISLQVASTSQCYTNTFSSSYIQKLTQKTTQPLTFKSFCNLVTAALSNQQEYGEYHNENHNDNDEDNVDLRIDILTVHDLDALRIKQGIERPVTTLLTNNKRYLIVSNIRKDANKVHYPLPLIQSLTQSTTKPLSQSLSSSYRPSSSSSAVSAPSLSSLTITIDQLSRALKEARREVREERANRRAREREDETEREKMKEELNWMKQKINQREEERKDTRDEHRIDDEKFHDNNYHNDAVRELAARLQHEMKLRLIAEKECQKWKEAYHRLRDTVTQHQHQHHDTSQITQSRGRERERSSHHSHRYTRQRVLSSRSASPSYLRPTSSTNAKRVLSPNIPTTRLPLLSLEHNYYTNQQQNHNRPISSSLKSKSSSIRLQQQQPQRSSTPPIYSSRLSNRERSVSPRPRFDPSAYVEMKQQRILQQQQKKAEELSYLLHQGRMSQSIPSSPQHRSVPSLTQSTSSWTNRQKDNNRLDISYNNSTDEENKNGDIHNHQEDVDERIDESESKYESVEPDGANMPSSSSVATAAGLTVLPISSMTTTASNVHSRLSALQSFLRSEKEKITAMTRGGTGRDLR